MTLFGIGMCWSLSLQLMIFHKDTHRMANTVDNSQDCSFGSRLTWVYTLCLSIHVQIFPVFAVSSNIPHHTHHHLTHHLGHIARNLTFQQVQTVKIPVKTAHLGSLMRVFPNHLKNLQDLGCPNSIKQRLALRL